MQLKSAHQPRAGCRVHQHALSCRHQAIRRSHQAAHVTRSAAIDWDAVYNGAALPARHVGPVELQELPEKGRGLVATRPIKAGELLLVSKPVVYLTSEGEESLPDVQRLLQKLNHEQYTEQQLAWLRSMYAGDAHAAPGPVPPLHEQEPGAAAADGQQQQQPQQQSASATRGLQEADIEEALRLNVLALNMFGEEFQDLPASAARGDAVSGHLGLWPEFSLLNHSCAPNAINYTIGDSMVVRAAQDVPQGTELCINYLGRSSLRPTSERLLDLRDGYGFACACPRCAAEMDPAYAEAVGAVQDVFGAVMYDMVPGLQAALGDFEQPAAGGDDAQAVKSLAVVEAAQRRLQPLLESLEARVAASAAVQGAPPLLGDWLHASAYEAYALQAQLDDIVEQLRAGISSSSNNNDKAEPASGGGSASSPAAASATGGCQDRMLDVAGSVATGSDLHLFLAIKALSQAQQAHGPESEAARKAEERAAHVVKLRYGMQLQPVTLAKLMQGSADALQRVAV